MWLLMGLNTRPSSFVLSLWPLLGWMHDVQTGIGDKKLYVQSQEAKVFLNDSKLQSGHRFNHLSASKLCRLASSEA